MGVGFCLEGRGAEEVGGRTGRGLNGGVGEPFRGDKAKLRRKNRACVIN